MSSFDQRLLSAYWAEFASARPLIYQKLLDCDFPEDDGGTSAYVALQIYLQMRLYEEMAPNQIRALVDGMWAFFPQLRVAASEGKMS